MARDGQPLWAFSFGPTIPEAVLRHWWQGFLHNQSALARKIRRLRRRNTVVVSIPYHLGDSSASTSADKTETGAPEAVPELSTVVIEPAKL